jgi:uncharacterized membrane protein YbaN (DUF454 family)
MKTLFILLFGHIFLVLGVAGALLPVLPTTPFLLLAAFCYSKSNPKLLHWLKNHKVFGPPLNDWQDSGVIGIKAKWIASVMVGLVMFWRIPNLDVSVIVKGIAIAVLAGVLVFIWTRPSRKI